MNLLKIRMRLRSYDEGRDMRCDVAKRGIR
jgi:hypothetical protein